MQFLVLPFALATLALATAQPTVPAGGRIVGEWRGTSVCTNRELAPACNDETVRYVFTGPALGTNTYHCVADKLVAGSYETMGELDFEYVAADGTWTCVFEVRDHAKHKWWLRVEKSHLVGGLTTDSGDAIRKVSAKRYAP